MRFIQIGFVAAALMGFGTPSLQAAHHEHEAHQMDAHEGQVTTLAEILSVDVEARKIKASHEAIPEISWPAMTMDFAVTEEVDLSGLAAGDKVQLSLARAGDGIYHVVGILPVMAMDEPAPMHEH